MCRPGKDGKCSHPFPTRIECPACDGKPGRACPACNGRGQITVKGCPWEHAGGSAFRLLFDLAAWAEKGAFPVPGLLNNTHSFLRAARVVWSEQARLNNNGR